MDPVDLPAETITLEIVKQCNTPTSSDHDVKFGVPTLEELGKVLRSVIGKSTCCVSCTNSVGFDLYCMYFVVLGFDTEGLTLAVWPGGETEALFRLEQLEQKVGRHFESLLAFVKKQNNDQLFVLHSIILVSY